MTIKDAIKWLTGMAFLNGPAGRALHRCGLVLMLHRVVGSREEARLPHNNPLCVDRQSFSTLLAFLQRHFELVELEVALSCAPAGERPVLALTFDDGWQDNYRYAFPVLQEQGVPASIFLSTAYIGQKRGFWWESVARRLWHDPETVDQDALRQALTGSRILLMPELFSPAQSRARSLLIADFVRQLKWLDPLRLHGLADELFYDGSTHAMNWQEVAQMERSGLIRFGAHGHEHHILTLLQHRDCAADIFASQRLINQHCVRPLKQYCYPNGDHHADLHELLGDFGYTHALGVEPGVVSKGCNRFALPRIDVSQKTAEQPGLLAWRILQAYRNSLRQVDRV